MLIYCFMLNRDILACYVLRGQSKLFHILLPVRVKANVYEPDCYTEKKQQREADAQAG